MCRLLLEKFGTAERIFASSQEELTAAGISRPAARALVEFRDFELLEKQLCELPRIGARLVRWSDAGYPFYLRHIADPPPYLFVRGTLQGDERQCVAVVGARAASDAGLRMAERLGLELAAKGITVVSGLARGIDGAAQRGALDAGGRTIGVLGSGIDVIYPPEHRKLADAVIAGNGAIVSELPVGAPPAAENFPGRNRIISGLSLGVVVVEAGEKSGSLITARMALEQDRQVFAVPGSPLSGKSRGSNRLLREGALLVECVEDVIEALSPQLLTARADGGKVAAESPAAVGVEASGVGTPSPRIPTGAIGAFELAGSDAGEVETLVGCLKNDERLHVDSLIEMTGLGVQKVLRLLLELELKGRVVQHPGKLFSLA